MRRDYKRLDAFLTEREKDIGFTLVSEAHERASKWAISMLKRQWGLTGLLVLDVGCGNGENCVRFAEAGAQPFGLTMDIDPRLTEAAKVNGFDVILGDQSFMDFMGFEKEQFEIVFARHVLEHSVMPYFTLCEYNRVLKMGWGAYVEVPAPNTEAGAEVNHNHYSVLGDWMWKELMARSGFEVLQQVVFKVGDESPTDLWWGFFLKKVDEPALGWAASHEDVENRAVRGICTRYSRS